jgi:hypothetical protein
MVLDTDSELVYATQMQNALVAVDLVSGDRIVINR